MDWLDALQLLRGENRGGVLATVSDVRGHAPRAAGAKMVVAEKRTWDTLGGGNLEATVVERARAMLANGVQVPEILNFSLNERATVTHGRQCCGGVVQVLLDPLPVRPVVAVFGMGHVGHELARILSRFPLRLHLVDSREGQVTGSPVLVALDGPAHVCLRHAPAPETVLGELPAGSHVLVMSHDHAEDFILCDAALRRGDLANVGLIGSAAKWTRFRARLLAEGHSEAAVSAIRCPVGVPGIPGKTPAAIAVSAVAELLGDLELPAPGGAGASDG
ncbi:xanthine dehydrogenase accessory protein XdhC [Kocuria tytonicola]|uniref:Xanthine dehydrogenase accessory protein XdhC n=1 Tax=Kocuria tytonicola TaxID=2055946 RepID=A0A3L9L5U5_9MICC|nr:xanthine dehydrogenase accessory protein XdhC [Kocuria tytonicola]RLZ03109.1 xanthine dehydrogenase accessory protein XdhC [Kocuria tytonicola]